MKNALYIINGILLIAVGVLFYLFFTEKKNNTSIVKSTWIDTSKTPTRIAYFEWDSIENQKFYKQMQDELNQKREEVDKKKMKLGQIYQQRLDSYNKKEMSQVESEKATQDMQNLATDLKGQADKLEQDLNDYILRKKVDFNDKIRNFLKQYNRDKRFSYVIANEPGFIFYRDSAFDITNDVVTGLNQIFSEKK
jgi:outer membrane protein